MPVNASTADDTPTRHEPHAFVAAVTCGCLVAAAIWFAAAGGLSGGLVHHDAAVPRAARFTVDVNTADEAELAALPGVGPATARRILMRRRTAGRFTTIDELLDVPGIGPVKLAAMRPHLRAIEPHAATTNGEPSPDEAHP